MGRRSAIDRQQLRDAADQLLSGLQARKLLRRGKADDAFEFWLWALTLNRASATGHSVRFEKTYGPYRAKLRTSAGHRGGNYTHAVITGNHGTVELHTGIYVEGYSTAEHEVDVVAVQYWQAAIGSSTVPYSDIQWAIEAKLYSTKRSLPATIPRAVLGTAYDLGVLPGFRRGGRHHHQRRFTGPWMLLASSATVASDGQKLLRVREPRKPVDIASAITSATPTRALLMFLDRHLSAL